MNDCWQTLLKQGFNEIGALLDFVGLHAADLPVSIEASQQFAFKVPMPFAQRMVKGDANDPLLRQVLPVKAELNAQPGFIDDPLGEKQANVLPGLLHKYHGRVLFMLTGHCAVNCRYCFRRSFDYGRNRVSRAQWQTVFDYVAADQTIEEVILSGGDPLLITDSQLDFMLTALEAIPHVKRLRIHSRLPIVLPQRMTTTLLNRLQLSRLLTVLVVHANHANEIDQTVERVLFDSSQAGPILLNQSVLLAGVNDSVKCLAELSKKLFACHVQPYYLHLLDPVAGTSHFEVDYDTAVGLVSDLRSSLSGYLVPRLCRELAGQDSKKIIA